MMSHLRILSDIYGTIMISLNISKLYVVMGMSKLPFIRRFVRPFTCAACGQVTYTKRKSSNRFVL